MIDLGVINCIPYHPDCKAIEENKTCFHCPTCLKYFCEILPKVGHICQGQLGRTENLFETCEYCKGRLDALRQLQVLRSGFKPLLKQEISDFFSLKNLLSWTYDGPFLSGFYVDHLCEHNLDLETVGYHYVKKYLTCRICFSQFRLLMSSSLLKTHQCGNYSCILCLFVLKSWSKLSVVSQVCTRFIYDELSRELDARKTLVEIGILRTRPHISDRPSLEDQCKLFRLYYEQNSHLSEIALNSLISQRIHQKVPPPLTTASTFVAIEGSIGVGKTALLKYWESLNKEKFLKFFYEPIEEWIDSSGNSLLKKFYESPEDNSFALQNSILISKLDQFMDGSYAPIKVFERSIISSFTCFLPILRKNNFIKAHEADILKGWNIQAHSWFAHKLRLDTIIYLKTTPEICLERIKARGREEESNISLEYLIELHQNYERWFTQLRLGANVRIIEIDVSSTQDDLEPKFKEIYTDLLLAARERGKNILFIYLNILI